MYGIFAYIYHKIQPHVGKHTIHGWYGLWWDQFRRVVQYVQFYIPSIQKIYFICLYDLSNESGQTTIIPKPEWRDFAGIPLLLNHHFSVSPTGCKVTAGADNLTSKRKYWLSQSPPAWHQSYPMVACTLPCSLPTLHLTVLSFPLPFWQVRRCAKNDSGRLTIVGNSFCNFVASLVIYSATTCFAVHVPRRAPTPNISCCLHTTAHLVCDPTKIHVKLIPSPSLNRSGGMKRPNQLKKTAYSSTSNDLAAWG